MPDTNADRYVRVRMAIAANIRAERARRRLSQQQVADGMRLLGYGNWYQQTAGAVERGDRDVQADELIALAEVLNAAPDVLWRVP
jgi:transcriptional regulator with XRE-family HTH domain